jgi:hypothetical protein
MREIKFRQWDSVHKRYQFDIGVTGPGSWCGPSYVTWEKYPLEQFTGLHDKNGKEIYEGDIISGASDLGVGIAKWNYDSWVLINHFLDSEAMLDDGEVIGNIHENPELVK